MGNARFSWLISLLFQLFDPQFFRPVLFGLSGGFFSVLSSEFLFLCTTHPRLVVIYANATRNVFNTPFRLFVFVREKLHYLSQWSFHSVIWYAPNSEYLLTECIFIYFSLICMYVFMLAQLLLWAVIRMYVCTYNSQFLLCVHIFCSD